jgi:hypothetical protein
MTHCATSCFPIRRDANASRLNGRLRRRKHSSLIPTTDILTAAQWTTHAYLRSLAQLCRYRSRALEQHPDKHTNNGAAELAKAEADFKMLGEALEILTDTMKRQLYDEGYDKAAIDERVAAAHRAARSNDNHRGGGGHHH